MGRYARSANLVGAHALAPQPASAVSFGRFRPIRERATFPQVSAASACLCASSFRVLRTLPQNLRASLWSRISDIRILLLETQFESTETGSRLRLRFGANRGGVNSNTSLQNSRVRLMEPVGAFETLACGVTDLHCRDRPQHHKCRLLPHATRTLGRRLVEPARRRACAEGRSHRRHRFRQRPDLERLAACFL
jgi:hypothetical protein